MRILYYSSHPHLNLSAPSGPGTHMRKNIEAWRKDGHEVATCILGGEHIYGDLSIHYSGVGLRAKLKKMIPGILWQTLKDLQLRNKDAYAGKILEEEVRRLKPDLIYERGFYMMTSGVETARKYGIPHIIELNAPYPEEKIELEGKSLMLKKALKLEAKQIRSTNMVVVVSSGLKEYYEGKYEQIRGKVLVTPNAIDPDLISVEETAEKLLRSKLDLHPEDTVIGFVGSIFPYHGVQYLLDSFREILKEHSGSMKLLVVGDGEILPELKRRSKEWGISENVIFTGNIPHKDVYSHISLMDITILANSKWYCSPIKIFEYGAMKKAIISINTQAVRDVMTHEKNGLLIDDPANDLSPALLRLIRDPQLRTELADRFYEDVMSKYTWQQTSRNILNFFRNVVQD